MTPGCPTGSADTLSHLRVRIADRAGDKLVDERIIECSDRSMDYTHL